MDVEAVLMRFVFVVLACIAVAFAYNVVRFKSFRGALFGARIRNSVGEVEVSRKAVTTTLLRVYVLDGDASKEVGLELVWKSPISYQVMPFSISRNDASALARLLESASAPSADWPRDSAG